MRTPRTQMAGRHFRLQPTIDLGLHLKLEARRISRAGFAPNTERKAVDIDLCDLEDRIPVSTADHYAGHCYTPISTRSLTSPWPLFRGDQITKANVSALKLVCAFPAQKTSTSFIN